MNDHSTSEELGKRYYLDPAAAFARTRLGLGGSVANEEAVRRGLESRLRLHRFKRTGTLPRVRRAIGILRGLDPTDLLDLGSGRGVFLWPMLEALSWLNVTAIDCRPDRVADLQAVHDGGVSRLTAMCMDATSLNLADRSHDVVTLLEALEHIPNAARAAAEALRVARRFVVVSVPSKEDDNPEHLHLFTRRSLEEMFEAAGAARVSLDGVLNHLIAVVKVSA